MDGTEQTYLAIVHLKGDPCQERMDGSTQEAVLLVSTLTFDLNSANQFCPTTTQKEAQNNTVVNQIDKDGPGGII